MPDLNVNEDLLGAYPWLERILAAIGSSRTRILIVADGIITFGHRGFGLSRLVEALRQSSRPGAEVVVSTAHRGASGAGREADDYLFKFEKETFGIDKYEQVWLFGYNEQGGELTESELKVLAEFMNMGGGVFATGDHANLGFALCGNVPRVRSMRKWCYPQSAACTSPAPPRNDAERHSTVLEGRDPGFQASDESDNIPQTIVPRLYQQGCEVNPHELLAIRHTAITVLPDHMHEGDCVEPTGEQLLKTIKYGDDPEFAEFPTKQSDGTRPRPEVIALSVSSGGRLKEDRRTFRLPVIPRGFGAICAYDPDGVIILARHMVGRVVVDASFHHFVDLNLDGTGALFGRGFFDASGRPTEHYEAITQYFRNIVGYLNPFPLRQQLDLKLLVLLRFMYPLIEEIRPGEGIENVLEVGELTRRAISSYLSPAKAIECAVTLLNSLDGHDALKGFINPRLASQSEMKGLAALLNVQACTNAILGGAMLRIAQLLPHEPDQAADKLLKTESVAGELATSVRDGVNQVASFWGPIIEESRKALSKFSPPSDEDKK